MGRELRPARLIPYRAHTMMNADQLRQSFQDFFEERGHQIVKSSSVLPDAPNLLFTNAGMNQFVPFFLGEREPSSPRIADSQKCIRAGGKHNDLDDVGFDLYHQTFFEMLGNWSFGDYFKKESIEWAWELMTKVWGMPKERLYATVYQPDEGDPAEFDQEAFDIWKAIFVAEGLDPAVHIVYGNKKDNFWMMGETGPCGPCSEIHIDLTPGGDTKGSLVNQDSAWCIELWNLVFIQFNALPDGGFDLLSQQYVDTGMGLERAAGVIATTNNFQDFSAPPSNYNSDLFTSIFEQLTAVSGHVYQRTLPSDRNKTSDVEYKDVAFRLIADHIRLLAISIADGITPGNEGRNYVLRRVLRRAVLFANRIGLPEYTFTNLLDPVVEKLGPVYPELVEHKSFIRKIIRLEEASFNRTINRGLQLFDQIAGESAGTIAGADAFRLYDTFGFPIDLTQLIAQERGLAVDMAGFDAELEKQRERSRAAQSKAVITVSSGQGAELPPTDFLGYAADKLEEQEAEILEVVHHKGDSLLVLDRTPFYAESGGQVGDAGTIFVDGQEIAVSDTTKNAQGVFFHRAKGEWSKDLVGQTALASIDTARRSHIERHHTATHVLHWALREVLGKTVRQTGSLVSESYLRFDFNHYEAVSAADLLTIERIANERILDNGGVSWYEVPIDEKPEEAMSFFEDKYGDIIRIVNIDDFSLELCGGTHVRQAGEMGLLKVKLETSISAGNRRVEAVAGEYALGLMQENFNALSDIAKRLACKPGEIAGHIQGLFDKRKELENELAALRSQQLQVEAVSLAQSAESRDGLQVVAQIVESDSPNGLRELGKAIYSKLENGLVILGAAMGEKASILCYASEAANGAGFKAGDVVRNLAGKMDGRGGGKGDYAMGGGSPDKLPAAFAATLAELFPA